MKLNWRAIGNDGLLCAKPREGVLYAISNTNLFHYLMVVEKDRETEPFKCADLVAAMVAAENDWQERELKIKRAIVASKRRWKRQQWRLNGPGTRR